jgi:hypothetical protein
MKPERRFDPLAFNPEKFLEQEKKKAAAKSGRTNSNRRRGCGVTTAAAPG